MYSVLIARCKNSIQEQADGGEREYPPNTHATAHARQ